MFCCDVLPSAPGSADLMMMHLRDTVGRKGSTIALLLLPWGATGMTYLQFDNNTLCNTPYPLNEIKYRLTFYKISGLGYNLNEIKY